MQSEDVLFFKNIKADIEKIVLGYVSVRSFTASCAENEAGSYFENYFANIDEFDSTKIKENYFGKQLD